MKKHRTKALASALVLTMSLSVLPAPAFAVSSNIVAETENVNKLTISQLQDLAVIYNNTAQKLDLSMKQLELSEQMLRNSRRSTEDAIQNMKVDMPSTSAPVKEQLENYATQYMTVMVPILMAQGKSQEEATEEAKELLSKDAQYNTLMLMYASAATNEATIEANISNGFDQAMAGLETINKNLDAMAESKDDLTKAMKDLQSQMRYSAGYLGLTIVQLDKSIELMQDQIALLERAVKIAEAQKKLGMTAATDLETANANLKNARNTLATTEATRTNLKRSLNVMIGRNAGNPLEIVPMSLPVAIENAPAYTEQLIQKLTDNNYKLKTLERDKTNLKDDAKDGNLGSDERQSIDYQVMSKDQEIKDQKDAISNDLRTMLNNINSAANAYTLSRQQLVTEQKTHSYAEKRYELGMISLLSKLSSDLSLKNAELTNMQNAYNYYLAWQKYNYAVNGVDMSAMQ